MTPIRKDRSAGKALPAERNVEQIARLERAEIRTRPLAARISLAITNTVGTFTFAIVHTVLLIAWCLWNVIGPEALRFDPYPYGLLTMIVSMEGVVLAIFVLITQNRMSAQSDQRDHLNLQVDLLAEQEMTMVLRMLKRIEEKLGIESDSAEESRTGELMQETNIYELMSRCAPNCLVSSLQASTVWLRRGMPPRRSLSAQ